jgi:hypothetical protein
VPSFGDAERAAVATLGINPSKQEFATAGQLLRGSFARFRCLPDLGVASLREASMDVIADVHQGCRQYFHRRPYRKWFDRLEEQLRAVGASYYDGSAAHLDLAHWATDPTWGDLTPDQRERLLEDGRSFLQWQLGRPHLRLVMLNGRAVILQFELWSGCPLQPVGQLPGPLGRAANLYRATLPGGALVLGWSTNLQSSFGVTTAFRGLLAGAVKRLYSSGRAA